MVQIVLRLDSMLRLSSVTSRKTMLGVGFYVLRVYIRWVLIFKRCRVCETIITMEVNPRCEQQQAKNKTFYAQTRFLSASYNPRNLQPIPCQEVRDHCKCCRSILMIVEVVARIWM